ncbi:MAG TPA: DNA topoisomerase IV subunit B [Mycobacteriales bacterium]|nr:DNA topoisomerase IV subunit B [Mycobacteriales bacterium]
MPPLTTATARNDYTAKHLSVLEGLEAVRKRPGMYIGSTDSRGLQHLLWEIVDNAVDEALGGHCRRIEVVLHADGSVEVRDDGRGIPVDVESKTGLTGLEVVLTRLHAGGKFGGGSYAASGGLHGVGASVVNALSARLDVEVDRAGATHAMSFRRGEPGVFAGPGDDAHFEPRSGPRTIKKVPKKTTGTRVRWWADRQIFLAEAQLDVDALHARARQTAFLVPGLAICVRDERPLAEGGEAEEETFRYDGGIVDFVDFLAVDPPVTGTLRWQGVGTFVETVPVLDKRGGMGLQEVTRELAVDIAIRWGSGYDTAVTSFVNIIATPKGGTHLAGFERALVKTANEALRATRILKVADDSVVKEDVLEGLTAVVTVRLAEPQFEGQTKEILGTAAATKIVAELVSREFGAFLTDPKAPKAHRLAARALLDKIYGAAKTRLAARAHKDLQRRKTALESSAMPAKLADCRSDDVDRTELFIVEGDSALGTAKLARNSEYQALLPIRGKILNVQKASVSDMLKNVECASITQVIGAGTGRTFDLDQVRYGKIIFMADADVDGSHIRCLLLTLVHRYMRPLLESGRVFAAVPPLHRVEVVGRKEPIYTYSESQMRRTVAELERKGKRVKDPIQRYKGLGEMDADQLAETTMDPGRRVLRRLTISDVAAAESTFELLMGNDVAPRKQFIVDSAGSLDPSRIDA